MAALEQGGRVTFRTDFRTSDFAYTPLLVAAGNGHTDICGLLLAHGSDVNELEPNSMQTAQLSQLTQASLYDSICVGYSCG